MCKNTSRLDLNLPENERNLNCKTIFINKTKNYSYCIVIVFVGFLKSNNLYLKGKRKYSAITIYELKNDSSIHTGLVCFMKQKIIIVAFSVI